MLCSMHLIYPLFWIVKKQIFINRKLISPRIHWINDKHLKSTSPKRDQCSACLGWPQVLVILRDKTGIGGKDFSKERTEHRCPAGGPSPWDTSEAETRGSLKSGVAGSLPSSPTLNKGGTEYLLGMGFPGPWTPIPDAFLHLGSTTELGTQQGLSKHLVNKWTW